MDVFLQLVLNNFGGVGLCLILLKDIIALFDNPIDPRKHFCLEEIFVDTHSKLVSRGEPHWRHL